VPVASHDGIMPPIRVRPRIVANGRVTDERANPRVGGVARSPHHRAPPPRGNGRPRPVFGCVDGGPHLLPDHRSVFELLSAFLTESFAFYLYVAYAERLTSDARRSEESIPLARMLRNLLLAAPVVPAVASLAAIVLPTAAASLVEIPGLWLMTRWSLFAPVIVTELLGPLAALRRSNELVRGHFELVFLTAAFAVVLEEAVADAGMLGGLALTGSETWGQWAGAPSPPS
jgi:hypothetical protein